MKDNWFEVYECLKHLWASVGSISDKIRIINHLGSDTRKNMVIECKNLRIKQIYTQLFKIGF